MRCLLTLLLCITNIITTAQVKHPPVIIGLDHIPIAVSNLDSAAVLYKKLGFSIKNGRFHSNGIQNLHVKFKDGTELELITAPAVKDTLTAFYRKFIQEGGGPAFLALYVQDTNKLVSLLRNSRLPFIIDNGYPEITPPHPLDFLFFGGRNKSATDKPVHFAHSNTAESLISVWLAPDNTQQIRQLLSASGATLNATSAVLPEGKILFFPTTRRIIPHHPIIGVTLRVHDIQTARNVLTLAGFHVSISQTANGKSILLSPPVTGGLWLELCEEK
ncbi:glyoxalase-like protein [Chitinophaga dinghuensis]|uniref:Glyoxalase-like protein n=1 Tax=Chitinophaga dinghuensis TaxID=1539050 RepID=A0A327W476_9BACT|nr:VOC family protein [Chitinophaga dinghuensis]RAJ83592.1 glyoxalase-like protein [Chitinophaga dinghuensis]